MKTFDSYLAELYNKGLIRLETAMEKAFDPENFSRVQFKDKK